MILVNYPGGDPLFTGKRGKGGVWNYFETLRPYLGVNVEYFTIGSRRPNESALEKTSRIFKDYLRFYKSLRNGNYSLVHLNPSLDPKAVIRDGFFLFIAWALKNKILVFIHGWDPDFEKLINRKYLPLFRFIYFRADGFIVLAKKFSKVLQKWGYQGPIYVETTVVADNLIDGNSSALNDTDRFKVLFLSSIEKNKGIYEALQAYDLVKKKYPHVMMTVAGTGSEFDSAREYVHEKGIDGVSFIGWVEGNERREAFCNSDVYLFPSWHGEGMPTSVLEAMGCGLPVITTDVGGLSDFFESGSMGFMTNSTDPGEFACLIEALITSPNQCDMIGTYNREYARRKFAASVVAQRLIDIYGKTSKSQD